MKLLVNMSEICILHAGVSIVMLGLIYRETSLLNIILKYLKLLLRYVKFKIVL